MGRAQFQQVVANAPKQQLKTASNNPNVAIGATTGEEVIDFYSAAGTIGLVQAMYIYIPAPVGATLGTHELLVSNTVPAGSVAYGASVFGSLINFDFLNFVVADSSKSPVSDTGQGHAIKNAIFDDVKGFRINYRNKTNVANNSARSYAISYVETVRG